MALALAALAFNIWLLPRIGGRWLWRPAEVGRGQAIGVVIYPLTVLVLLAIFNRRPEVAAAGWGLLAFGDGAATVVGQRWGRVRLPWNREKSWAGLLAYLGVGWVSVVVLIEWTTPGLYEIPFLAAVAAVTAFLAALLESAPQRLDDNLGVPLVASLLLVCLLGTADGWARLLDPSFHSILLLGLLLNAVLAVVAHALGTLDVGGATLGCLMGTVIFAFLSWGGYLVLVVFFALGSLSTRIGYRRKAEIQVAQGRGGRRRAANALANGGVAAVCAELGGVTLEGSIFVFGFACSMAAAAADTVESEIGQVWGRPTLLVTSLQPVEPGTNGGVSPIGTLSGLLAAVLTAGAGWVAGLYPLAVVFPLSLLALVATLVESVAGATLERAELLDNNGVNFLNTLLAALLGAGLALTVG